MEADSKAVTEAYAGYIHGWKRRAIFPFIVGHESQSRWVFFHLGQHFLVDLSSHPS
jgi:hypothetical protein